VKKENGNENEKCRKIIKSKNSKKKRNNENIDNESETNDERA